MVNPEQLQSLRQGVTASEPQQQAGAHRGQPPPDGRDVVQEPQAQPRANPRHCLPPRHRLGSVLDSGGVLLVPWVVNNT